MELTEKIAKLEELMDLSEGTLQPETVLAELECWDSMTRLGIIVMMDEDFGKTLNGPAIRDCKTVQDILNYME